MAGIIGLLYSASAQHADFSTHFFKGLFASFDSWIWSEINKHRPTNYLLFFGLQASTSTARNVMKTYAQC